jgi:Flp pilus assembly protein TadG
MNAESVTDCRQAVTSMSAADRRGALRPRPARTALARRLHGFVTDRRGSTAVQAIVLMPMLLLVFMAGIKIWEVISIRRSLNTGVALATRYLSLYPPRDANETTWSDIAAEFVYAALKNNAFVDKPYIGDRSVPVSVSLLDGGNQCTDDFEVTAVYPLNVQFRVGMWASPSLEWAQLADTRKGEVVCD